MSYWNFEVLQGPDHPVILHAPLIYFFNHAEINITYNNENDINSNNAIYTINLMTYFPLLKQGKCCKFLLHYLFNVYSKANNLINSQYITNNELTLYVFGMMKNKNHASTYDLIEAQLPNQFDRYKYKNYYTQTIFSKNLSICYETVNNIKKYKMIQDYWYIKRFNIIDDIKTYIAIMYLDIQIAIKDRLILEYKLSIDLCIISKHAELFTLDAFLAIAKEYNCQTFLHICNDILN